MTEDDEAIIELLARVDAIFWPRREPWTSQSSAAHWEAMQQYFAFGIPAHGGGDAASRKSAQRKRKEMQQAGLITIVTRGAKGAFLRLTDFAEYRARAAVGLPGMKECLAAVYRLELLFETEGPDFGRHIAETHLAGMHYADDGNGAPFVDLAEALLPALCRHWIRSDSDGIAHVWYEMGPNAAAIPRKLGKSLLRTFTKPKLPDAEQSIDLYFSKRCEERQRILAAPHRTHDLGFLPMPQGIGWLAEAPRAPNRDQAARR